MLSFAFLLLALIAGAFGAGTEIISKNGLSFSGNVSTAQSDARFDFRALAVTSSSLPILGNLLTYSSFEIAASGSSSGGAAHVDAIIGVATSPNSLSVNRVPPSSYLAYFDADAQFDLNNLNLDTKLTGSAGVVGKAFVRLEEVSASGESIKTFPLKARNWVAGTVVTSGPNGELKYVTFTSNQDNFVVEITVAVSAILGKLNVGGATITPTSLESFIEVHNFPYSNPSNHLRLVLYIGHAAAKASSTFKSTNTIIAGSGNEQVYIKLDGSAVVDGNTVSVKVDGLAKTDLTPSELNDVVFSGQLTASGELKSEVRKVVVDFPAGAVEISYDPSIGFGAPNAAGLLLPSFGALLLSIAVFFFAL